MTEPSAVVEITDPDYKGHAWQRAETDFFGAAMSCEKCGFTWLPQVEASDIKPCTKATEVSG
jgi:hypothetical protein